MRRLFLVPIGMMLVLASCTITPPLPDHPGAVAAIEDYYRQHAWEEGARCVLPRMDVTQADVVKASEDRLVVDVRYFWRDSRNESDNSGTTCAGFASRTFTLVQGQVVEMAGEQRH
jgi:hypothetical protein